VRFEPRVPAFKQAIFIANIFPRVGAGVRVTKSMGSRLDEWIYWCSFTFTLTSDSLQSLTVHDLLHSLLDHKRLPFYYDERRIPAHTLNCFERWLSLESTLIHFWRQSQSNNYFRTGGLPPISSSWGQAPWDSGPQFFQLNTCFHSLYVTSSLTRGWVSRLQLQLALASAVIPRSESRETHDRILLSQIRDSPNLEGQVPIFISSRNRVAKLYPQALGSLLVTSYDSQGYGGGIRPRLHTGLTSESESESYVTTDGQPASLSWNKAPSWAYDQIFIIVWQSRSHFFS
jgi:hypothetical protein